VNSRQSIFVIQETIPTNSMRRTRKKSDQIPILISFVGSSGAGKTKLVVRLIKELARRKLQVGAVKHSRAGFQLDYEGKDSARLKEAGARTVLLAGQNSLTLITEHNGTLTPEDVAEKFFSGMDIVLVEGWKESALPKILVRGAGAPPNDIENVIAEVGTVGAVPGVPLFLPDSVEKLADFVLSFNQ
jgi:molybdopterin-guanine dinucleotide biosynthesis protein B